MTKMINKETRISEIQAVSEEKMIIEGYAIKFNEQTLIGTEAHGFKEIIASDALTETNMKDVPLKYNHQDNFLVIARTRNKSLELEVDEVGLKIRAELLDTQSNQDIYKMVKSGLLDKMSFAFTVKNQSWDRAGMVPVRTIQKIDRLYDVSIVDVPAYEGTSVYARSLELLDNNTRELENLKHEYQKEIIRKKIKIKGDIH
ncbi:HK97 family phage prohead protease [Acholeplasma vituli]|uniref:HK97 family phage prohead protease n=1 Tax=Paracholeplasma vituli TaxID=69473 RepID=A0ABT2PU20_9MOLU|nr:HK97 family phage prohead protease [Paracholeplasma vituli]MCU0104436.1 HK97 family phage prohead protease [Paracholeplasma vituli]